MRIVGGELRGRTLHAPSGLAVRPTSERVREALFNILTHRDYALEGARVMDLFAGTGALGIEALSRGAQFALFVEESASARAAIRRNIEALGLTGRTRIFRRDATRLGAIPAGLKPFSLAFLDPPYGKGLAQAAIEALHAGDWLASDCRLVIEGLAGEEFAFPETFRIVDERDYGETKLYFLAM